MWNTYLIQTRTGNIGPRIEPENLSWSMTINETESMSLTLRKSSIPKLKSPLWIEPWWGGVALFWNNTPIVAGPIISRPRETFDTLDLACGGIRALFAYRSVTQDMGNWSDLTKPDRVANWHYIHYDKTYATLARQAVARSLTKYAGDLPINFKVPETSFVDPATVNGVAVSRENRPHFRRYAGYNVLNQSVDVALTELSEQENGPDVMFRPVYKGGTNLSWDMWTGINDNYPEIWHDSETVWDTTSQSGYISELEVVYTGTKQTNRAFAISQSGSGGGSMIRMAQNVTKFNQQYPLLESMESVSGSPNSSQLQGKANAALKANDEPRHQLNATVRVDGINQLGTFWPGEYGKLITNGWYGLKNGETRAKILTMSGDLSMNMRIGFKEMEIV